MEEAMKDGCEGWTTRRAPHMEKYAEIRDVVVEGAPEACRLSLKVDSQSFLIGDYFETRAEAEWSRDMLCIALDRLVNSEFVVRGLPTSPKVSVGEG